MRERRHTNSSLTHVYNCAHTGSRWKFHTLLLCHWLWGRATGRKKKRKREKRAASVTSLPTLLSTQDWWLCEIFPKQSLTLLYSCLSSLLSRYEFPVTTVTVWSFSVKTHGQKKEEKKNRSWTWKGEKTCMFLQPVVRDGRERER